VISQPLAGGTAIDIIRSGLDEFLFAEAARDSQKVNASDTQAHNAGYSTLVHCPLGAAVQVRVDAPFMMASTVAPTGEDRSQRRARQCLYGFDGCEAFSARRW
jgi:hypothetical protein